MSAPTAPPPAAGPPLAGVRVVDVTTTFLGPYCTHLMAQMGADVIKVERPEGDVVRYITDGRSPGMSAIHVKVNRGKRSLAVDLKDPDGRRALGALLATADVFVHNMRPQAAARLGLDYESVRCDNPTIVHCAAFGFGEDGPYAGRPAYDDIVQCVSGFAALQGTRDATPTYVVSNIADKTCGVTTLYAILAALFARERTGQGQSIEVPMFETMCADILLEHTLGMVYEPPTGPPGYQRTLSRSRRPYRTADGFLGVLLYTDSHWRRFLVAMTREDLLDDPRYATMAGRTAHTDDVYGFLESLLSIRTTAEWMELFGELDVPCAEVKTIEDLFTDPHLAAVGFFEMENHPTEGRLRHVRSTVTFAGDRPPMMRPAPALGGQSREVLLEAGLPEETIARLVDRKVVHVQA